MRNFEKTINLLSEKCTDCKICELICSAAKEQAFNRGKARLHVEHQGLLGLSLSVCRLCDHPACVLACPTHAIEVADGMHIITIQASDCDGCGRCVEACPHGALSMWPNRKMPVVCDFCANHPKCVSACPWGALEFDFHTVTE